LNALLIVENRLSDKEKASCIPLVQFCFRVEPSMPMNKSGSVGEPSSGRPHGVDASGKGAASVSKGSSRVARRARMNVERVCMLDY